MLNKSIDVFPALIKLAPPGSLSDYTTLQTTGDVPEGTRRVDRSRAVVINNVLVIAQDSPEGPLVVFKEAVEEIAHEGKTTHVLTVSGKIIAIAKDDNCGCGSRLRGWNPRGSAIVTSSEDPNA
jgi:hypothetical protein